jgi:potassium-transporting ATPase KdpC subunit
MKKNLITSVLMTIAMTVLLGLIYPLVVTGLAQVFFRDKANGQIIVRNGQAVGSRILGQQFTEAKYFHSRPSGAGNGYDPLNSGSSQMGPTNQKLIDRVKSDVAALQQENPGQPIPVDMVTQSASGLDPDISPANAEFQIPRVAKARGIPEAAVSDLVRKYTAGRELGLLGEPRVNVLELNLALDDLTAKK